MSFLERLKSALSGGAGKGHIASQRLYIIDTTQLAGSNGGRDSRSPRDQFKLLQRLARFADREKIQVIAVMDGRPLNEAAEGAEYNGVRVHYAPKTADISGRVFELAERQYGRHDVTVITADRKLEERAGRIGASIMRVSTLRKAMDDGGGGERSRSPRRGRRSRRRQGDRSQPESKEPSGRRENSGSGVHDLIDLVD